MLQDESDEDILHENKKLCCGFIGLKIAQDGVPREILVL